ncbi:MAG: hypothetical protein JXB15_01595 [Anaerolineales bacterium]|nr:hypothetical protein [Anaerolineales bacterium]
MRTTPNIPTGRNVKTISWLAVFILIFSLGIASCNFDLESGDSLQETQTAISIQQTDLATKAEGDLQGTVQAQQATIDALGVPPTPDLMATQIAGSVQQTMAAQLPPVEITPPPGETAIPIEAPPDTPFAPPDTPVVPPEDFNARMKQASILLFEDIVNDPSEYRYAQRTLDAMGLNYKDDGSAKGWLKTDLLGNGPNGQPWDLVILAIEVRGGVSGEYFEYLQDVLNKGSAVILEAWHLDAISEGTISPILADCGVQIYPYFPKTGTVNDVVIWPLSGVSHPILNEPNSGMSFTKARDKWLFSFDLGSLMALTGTGDAMLLLGTNATKEYQDGALAVCKGGQLIIQTFSSHSFPYNVMYPLWENYIYNALRWRLQGSP